MDHNIAVDFLRDGVNHSQPSRWLEIGAGTGVFTRALGEVLGAGSVILATDKDPRVLKSIPPECGNAVVKTIAADFEDALPDEQFDGILLANVLHFAYNQDKLMKTLKGYLSQDGRILLVEYDMARPSQWVPYPLPFAQLEILSFSAGFSSVRKLFERQSAYGEWNLYSAVVR